MTRKRYSVTNERELSPDTIAVVAIFKKTIHTYL